MENFITGLVMSSGATAIKETKTVSYRDLYCTDISYVADGQFMIARSFWTHMWAAPTVKGPARYPNGVLKMRTISDIAIVFKCATVAEWKHFKGVKREDIQCLYTEFEASARTLVERWFESAELPSNMLSSISFRLVPTPSLVVAITREYNFLGSLIIDAQNNVEVATRTSDDIYEVVRILMNNAPALPVYKERLLKCVKSV